MFAFRRSSPQPHRRGSGYLSPSLDNLEVEIVPEGQSGSKFDTCAAVRTGEIPPIGSGRGVSGSARAWRGLDHDRDLPQPHSGRCWRSARLFGTGLITSRTGLGDGHRPDCARLSTVTVPYPDVNANCLPQRHRARRLSSTFKQWRGLASRYDQLAINYRGGALLRAIVIWASDYASHPSSLTGFRASAVGRRGGTAFPASRQRLGHTHAHDSYKGHATGAGFKNATGDRELYDRMAGAHSGESPGRWAKYRG